MSWNETLENVIATVSPSWAAQRRLARYALSQVERLATSGESTWGRLDRAPTNRGSSADYDLELGFDRRRLVERARLADDRNLLAGAILDRSVESVVGEGFRLQALSDDKDWNRRAEALWNEWSSDAHAADSRGLLTWPEILGTLYRSELRDGDAGLALIADGTTRSIESDEIADPHGGHSRPDMVDGVELDERGRPRAFHVFDRRTNVLWADRRVAPSTRIAAEEFVFLARRKRSGQTRGVTAFQGMFWLLDQIDGTLEAITVATRMAACVGLVIKKAGGAAALGSLPSTTDGAGNSRRKFRMEPGGVMVLERDEDVTPVSPSAPTGPARDHIRELERLCSARFPITLEMVLGDYTASNYSNSRIARLEARERARIHQAKLSRASTSVYFWKLLNWIEAGLLAPRPDALRHKWIRPGWALADPLVELQAAQAAIDSGLSTRTIEAARLGYEFEEDLVPQLKHEKELLEREKLPVVRSNLTREPAAPPAEPSKKAPEPPGTEAPPAP